MDDGEHIAATSCSSGTLAVEAPPQPASSDSGHRAELHFKTRMHKTVEEEDAGVWMPVIVSGCNASVDRCHFSALPLWFDLMRKVL
jgi:hypothetical protein